MAAGTEVNVAELRRYVRRISDRWPVDQALLGGPVPTDRSGSLPQRESGPEYVVILVSEHFDGVPWLERIRQAELLWDNAEMGAPAEVHCYTRVEFERKLAALPVVRRAAEQGIDLLGA